MKRERPQRTEKGGCRSDDWLKGWRGPASSGWEKNGFSGITHGHPSPLKHPYFLKSGLVQTALDFLRTVGPNHTVFSREVCCSSLKQQNKPCRLYKGTKHCPREPPIARHSPDIFLCSSWLSLQTQRCGENKCCMYNFLRNKAKQQASSGAKWLHSDLGICAPWLEVNNVTEKIVLEDKQTLCRLIIDALKIVLQSKKPNFEIGSYCCAIA